MSIACALRAASLCVLALFAAAPAEAQAPYPTRPVKLVVPLTAGGPGDVLARAIAQKMSEAFGQQVVVENRGGANMNVGAEFVARAERDGYTLLVSATPMLVNPAMYAQIPYDNLRDFTHISLVASFPLVLIANPELPVKTIPELIDHARRHPGELNYGSAGNGSLTHLAGEMLASMTGVKLVHVPYRGINEAVTDLIGGRVQLSFAGAPIALPNARSGKVRALAITGSRRTLGAPELPTIAEGGLPGYDVTPWYGISAPAGTPAPIVNRWHGELVRILQTAEIRERWLSLGADPVSSATPEEFTALVRAELAKWAKVVRDSGAKVQ